VALDQLERWARARSRLAGAADPEALHDFRVALRRLRSTLRAFRTEFAATVPRRTRRRLRRLARASGLGRDLEVQRAWIRAQREGLPPEARSGADWLLDRLDSRQREADSRFARRLGKVYDRLERRLRRALDQPDISPGGTSRRQPSAIVSVRRMIREGTAEFRRELRAVHSLADREHAHAARIAAKRLRYLLEPFTRELPGAEAAVAELTELQDLLGEFQDTHALAGELRAAFAEVAVAAARRHGDELLPWPEAGPPPTGDPPPDVEAGLVALSLRLSLQCNACFTRLEQEWLGTRADRLIAGLSAIGAARAPRSRRAPRERRGAER
jgi:CHAD domain-containing protein